MSLAVRSNNLSSGSFVNLLFVPVRLHDMARLQTVDKVLRWETEDEVMSESNRRRQERREDIKMRRSREDKTQVEEEEAQGEYEQHLSST